jgi:hypothetical protein
VDRLFVADPVAARRSVVTLALPPGVRLEAHEDDLLAWTDVWPA